MPVWSLNHNCPNAEVINFQIFLIYVALVLDYKHDYLLLQNLCHKILYCDYECLLAMYHIKIYKIIITLI